MNRRRVLALLAAAALSRRAIAATKPKHIAILEALPQTENAVNLKAFREGLTALGYRENRDYTIDYRAADGFTERFPKLAASMVASAPDVIVTRGTPAAQAVKGATSTIPVVMAAVGDPYQLVTSLDHPGGNITGFSAIVSDLTGKRVEILEDLLPSLTSVGALINPDNPSSTHEWQVAETTAHDLDLEARLYPIRSAVEIQPAIEAARRDNQGALIVGLDTLTQNNAGRIAAFAAEARLPAIYAAREFVAAGGLLLYGVNYPDLYRRTAGYVDKILKGASPADLPIETASKVEFVINLKAAKALGLTIPPDLLARADDVVR
ncbi:MAG TPA: ABC transporter substrate-binding protein [Stellaceae bacterium]|nr:ABC transporter substrate-binding protein [Stellaceae bacterium]